MASALLSPCELKPEESKQQQIESQHHKPSFREVRGTPANNQSRYTYAPVWVPEIGVPELGSSDQLHDFSRLNQEDGEITHEDRDIASEDDIDHEHFDQVEEDLLPLCKRRRLDGEAYNREESRAKKRIAYQSLGDSSTVNRFRKFETGPKTASGLGFSGIVRPVPIYQQAGGRPSDQKSASMLPSDSEKPSVSYSPTQCLPPSEMSQALLQHLPVPIDGRAGKFKLLGCRRHSRLALPVKRTSMMCVACDIPLCMYCYLPHHLEVAGIIATASSSLLRGKNARNARHV